MKNIIKTKCLFIFTLVVLFSTSCGDDFLDQSNPNALTPDTFWQNEADATKGIIGAAPLLISGLMPDSKFFFLTTEMMWSMLLVHLKELLQVFSTEFLSLMEQPGYGQPITKG